MNFRLDVTVRPKKLSNFSKRLGLISTNGDPGASGACRFGPWAGRIAVRPPARLRAYLWPRGRAGPEYWRARLFPDPAEDWFRPDGRLPAAGPGCGGLCQGAGGAEGAGRACPKFCAAGRAAVLPPA